uniref:Uncharacterized protein n=1 Tax=Rangifer tarandus platyrhynchus TaxID=3082113 RepID=A0ACB0DSM7_RANTA|nr:unnamed protein product [Rangifer tarandus platyrhynchus]
MFRLSLWESELQGNGLGLAPRVQASPVGRLWVLASGQELTGKMAEVEQKKKRTFCKFTYRDVDLDQLLTCPMSN